MNDTIARAKEQMDELTAKLAELKVAFEPFRDAELAVATEAMERLEQLGDFASTTAPAAAFGLRA